jgi:beta-barrel assembly-enhancing protease
MKQIILAAALLTVSVPAFAQLGGIGGALKKAQESKQKVDDLTISDAEERQIGEDVSVKIRQRFGVVQDPAIHKYITLLGTTLAKQSERPNLNWTFVVLDTDGVNAFASPGGIVHVTRGALGFAKNEAELAGVIGHEIGHVAHKHTVNAIKKSNAVKMGSEAASARASFLSNYANRAYEMVLENSFDRGDELDADKVGVELAQKAGYLSASLGDFLQRLDERNKNQAEKNGMFASHPETKERIDKIRKQAASSPGSAVVEPRFKANVKYQVTPLESIAVAKDAAAATPPPAESKEEPKKKGFGLGNMKQAVAPESKSTQVSASGGARGLGADRAAKGGSNPTLVKTAVSSADVETFKKGIS